MQFRTPASESVGRNSLIGSPTFYASMILSAELHCQVHLWLLARMCDNSYYWTVTRAERIRLRLVSGILDVLKFISTCRCDQYD